jgi:hypothetical protein
LENPQEKFTVIISKPVEIYFYQILEYLFGHYSFDRAESIANQLRDSVNPT